MFLEQNNVNTVQSDKGLILQASKDFYVSFRVQSQNHAEILVPKRAERERISPQAWIGIGTALASLGAIIVSILR